MTEIKSSTIEYNGVCRKKSMHAQPQKERETILLKPD